MANSKISALTAATTPLDGTEVLPIVQTSTTKKVANNDLRPKQIQSNATSGVMQIVGPAAAATRVMTIPDANFTAARTDAAQSFTGVQTFNNGLLANYVNGVKIDNAGTTLGQFYYSGGLIINRASGTSLLIQQNSSSEMVLTTDGNVQIGSTSGSTARVFVYANNSAGDASGNAAIYVRQDGTNNIQAWAGSGGNIRAYLTSGGTFYLDDDNLVFNTAAKGINFTANTPAAGMTSQLLNWYEEGTWTPDQGAGLTVVGAFSSSGTYTRVGRMVLVTGTVSGATSVAIAATATQICTNLPFNCNGGHSGTMFNAAIGATGGVAASAGIVYAATTMAATPSITFTVAYRT